VARVPIVTTSILVTRGRRWPMAGVATGWFMVRRRRMGVMVMTVRRGGRVHRVLL
jgi:hypothetical protein